MRPVIWLLLAGVALAAAPRLDPHEGGATEARCGACHTGEVPKGAPPAAALLRASLDAPCGPCHTGPMHQGVQDHLGARAPSGVALPLVDGAIACFTCHDPHAERGTPPKHGAFADALQAAMRAEAGEALPSDARWPGRGPHTALLRQPLDQLCVGCHGEGP